jgi:hypothetical protein
VKRPYAALIALALLLGVALRLDALHMPFAFDDFAQRAMLEGEYPARRSPLDLYAFVRDEPGERQALMDWGSLPWWSHPRVRFAMLRPLASALAWADYALFGRDAVGPHVHSMLWWCAAVLAVAALMRALLPRAIAALATLLFALDEAHTSPVAWLANRTALVSVACGALGLWGYARFREQGRGRDGAVALAGFALALAGGEYALGFAGYIAAYELVAGRGGWRARARGLWPAVLPFAAYALAYRALGCGTAGSDVYLDPLAQPGAFARAAVPRLAMLLGDLLAGYPTERWPAPPALAGLTVAVAALGVALAGALVVRAARALGPEAGRNARWLALGALCSLAPVLASHPTGRLLVVAEVGACAALATIVAGAWSRAGGGWMRGAAAVLAVVHLGLAPWRARTETRDAVRGNRAAQAGLLASDLDPARLGASRVVVLGAADPQTLLYGARVWHAAGLPLPRAWWVLSMVPGRQLLRRTGDDTIELHALDGEMLTTPGERLFRPRDAPLREGDEVRLDGLTVTVLRVGAQGPRRVRYRFDRSLDAETLPLYHAQATGLRRVRPPPIGGGMVLGGAAVPVR